MWINCRYRTVFCFTCVCHRVEDLVFFEPHQRVTRRLARYIHDLCKVLCVKAVAERLERYRDGILNHCDYPIHTGRLEGINNTIKVIKRTAYGFHDDRYFALKVIQAFSHK